MWDQQDPSIFSASDPTHVFTFSYLSSTRAGAKVELLKHYTVNLPEERGLSTSLPTGSYTPLQHGWDPLCQVQGVVHVQVCTPFFLCVFCCVSCWK